jgi:hypothetical protein
MSGAVGRLSHPGRAKRAGLSWLASGVVTVVALSVVWAPAARAAEPTPPGAHLQADRSVPVRPTSVAEATPQPMPSFQGSPVRWPGEGSKTVDLPLSASGVRGTAKLDVGGLPVSVTPLGLGGDVLSGRRLATGADAPARVTISVFERAKAQAAGAVLAMRVVRADGRVGGTVRLRIDYSSFAHAYGGDWAWRLRAVGMPACALTAPSAAVCIAGRELETTVDGNSRVLTAEVDLSQSVGASAVALGGRDWLVEGDGPTGSGGDMVIMLMSSSSSSETGDFTKTDLKSSSAWAVSGNSGDFTYAYPIRVPPVPGGLVPTVALSYSSAAVDGQTAGGNTQPGPFGEGWSHAQSFIERTYRPCFDDAANSPHWTVLNSTGDLCWRLPNAQVNLNGKSSEIVLGDDGVWRLADDDGEKVEVLTGAPNSDNNGEHWKITTTDGTQYWFGRMVLPNGKGNTNSTPTVPVYANHSGEPCFSSSSAASSYCMQAWRWMLDYVVDPNGNEISYWYTRASNRTALLGSATSTKSYHRAVRLDKIEYGTHTSDPSTASAPPECTSPIAVGVSPRRATRTTRQTGQTLLGILSAPRQRHARTT